MNDSLIHYVEGGDLGTYPTWHQANEFRKTYSRKYLEPLYYRPNKNDPIGGLYESVLAPKKEPEPPEPTADMPVRKILDCILNLESLPRMTDEISHAHPELELGLARYPSQKVGAIKWLEGLIKRKKTSGREAYNEKQNLLCLLWLAEVLGEKANTLRNAIDVALACRTMPERCEAFRMLIPFDRIIALVENPQEWLLDDTDG